jgi:hypothetical protein
MLHSLVPPLRLPRARVEPITTPLDALGVLALAISRPLREELVVITCDDHRRGISIMTFDCDRSSTIVAHDVVGRVSATPNATGLIAAHVAPRDESLQIALRASLTRADLALRHFLSVSHGGVSSVD